MVAFDQCFDRRFFDLFSYVKRGGFLECDYFGFLKFNGIWEATILKNAIKRSILIGVDMFLHHRSEGYAQNQCVELEVICQKSGVPGLLI